MSLGSTALTRPVGVLVTGRPVEAVERTRGGFFELTQEAAQGAWAGEWRAIDATASGSFPSPDSLAGVVISGSPARLPEPESWMAPALEYTRELVKAETPLFGVCFGHQMLGEALGGTVGLNPRGREIGTMTLRVSVKNSLVESRHALAELARPRVLAKRRFGAAGASPPRVNMTHVDSVLTLPKGAKVFAQTELEPHALVQFGPKAWGVQFHPEFDAEVMRAYLEARRQAITTEGLDVEELVSRLGSANVGRETLVNFLQQVVLSGE